MITSKYIAVITAVVMVLSLIACGFFVYAANTFDTTKTTEYERRMFGDEVAGIDIQVDADEWQDMIDNAQSKEWISADVIINGTRFGTVGIRTKGNSSLSMGSSMGGSSNGSSYSLNFKANKYVKGQTFFGLDTFCVNNMIGDATYMKDYIAYDIMNFIGVDTPLVNYAKITVNGEDYGFGIMLERYDEAYLDRVHSTSAGELYSVKIGMGQRGDFEGIWQDVENAMPQRRQRTASPDSEEQGAESGDNNFDGNFPGGNERVQGAGGFGGGMGGGSLVYTDDNPDSYSSIFSNSVKNPDEISDSDKEKVITALENLNAGTDLEKYIDVDATLRYFAAHTVMVNNDSYTSNMAQNYYLYERDGKLTILPWDYNLSFGGMGGIGGTSGASSIVNFPIDTPVSGVNMEDRPLLNKLLEVDEYRDRYHEYLEQIVEGYFESGLYEETIHALDAKINDYVKNDVSANFTHEQYEASLPQFIELLRLRAESIKGQLDGIIPSTSSGQSTDSSALIDDSGVDLNALGSMGGGMGGGRGDRQNWQSELPGGQNGSVSPTPSELPSEQNRQSDIQNEQPDGQVESSPSPIIPPSSSPDEYPDVQGELPAMPNGFQPGDGGELPAMPEGFLGGERTGGDSGQPTEGQVDFSTMPNGQSDAALPYGEFTQLSAQSETPQQDGFDGVPNDNVVPDRDWGDFELMPQAMQILEAAGWELTDEVKAALLELGIPETQIDMFANMQGGFPGMGEQGGFPGGTQGTLSDANEAVDPQTQADSNMENIVIFAILMIILIGATVLVAKPRKNMI